MSGKNQMSVFMDKINTVSYSGLLSGFWVVGLWVAIHWTTLEGIFHTNLMRFIL